MVNDRDFMRLMAYADGELDAAERAEVELWLADDREARELLAHLKSDQEAIRRALDEELAPAVRPRSLLDLPHSRTVLPAKGLKRYLPYAAALLLGALVTHLADRAFFTEALEARVAALEQRQTLEQQTLRQTVSLALETLPSGEAAALAISDSIEAGRIVPLRTFKNSDGAWCREYRVEAPPGSSLTDHQGIACRRGKADWQTRLRTEGES